MRCCENILDQFKELFWARMLIDRALTVDRLFHQVNCEYEPVFLHIPEVLSIITKRKYDYWSIAEVKSHHRESSYPFGLSPSARWSAVHPWPQTLWSLPIASSERRAYSQQEQWTYLALHFLPITVAWDLRQWSTFWKNIFQFFRSIWTDLQKPQAQAHHLLLPRPYPPSSSEG